MDISLESSATELWQDTIDLLIQEDQPAPFVAMLQSCIPLSLEGSILSVKTNLRGAYNNIVKNQPVVEHYLSKAAFRDTKLSISFVQQTKDLTAQEKSKNPSFNPFTSVVSPEEIHSWNESSHQNTQASHTTQRKHLSKKNIMDVKKRNNPLIEKKITDETSKLTFDRFVVGEENEFAFEQALRVANDEKGKGNPLFIYGSSGCLLYTSDAADEL